MRTLSKQRPQGDPSRYDEIRRAVRDLEHAHRFFQHLHSLGNGSGLDSRKLQQHINFIAETHDKSLVRQQRLAMRCTAYCANFSRIQQLQLAKAAGLERREVIRGVRKHPALTACFVVLRKGCKQAAGSRQVGHIQCMQWSQLACLADC